MPRSMVESACGFGEGGQAAPGLAPQLQRAGDGPQSMVIGPQGHLWSRAAPTVQGRELPALTLRVQGGRPGVCRAPGFSCHGLDALPPPAHSEQGGGLSQVPNLVKGRVGGEGEAPSVLPEMAAPFSPASLCDVERLRRTGGELPPGRPRVLGQPLRICW